MSDAVAPSGWYLDPEGSGQQRWWDGAKWAPVGQGPKPPPPPPPPSVMPPPKPQPTVAPGSPSKLSLRERRKKETAFADKADGDDALDLDTPVAAGVLLLGKGTNGRVEVDGSHVTIRRTAMEAVLGLPGGDTPIPISAITAVHCKTPRVAQGNIQFVLAGASETRGFLGAMVDKNSVTFNLLHRDEFIAIRDHIEAIIASRPEHSSDEVDLTEPIPEEVILFGTGVTGRVEVDKEFVTIRRKGALAKMNYGWTRGEKRIPIAAITAVQFKAPKLANGYIQFTLSGGQESKRGILDATKDENSVLFNHGHSTEFAAIRDHIERIIAARWSNATTAFAPPQPPVQPPAATPTIPDQIRELGKLRDEGLLTDEEFAAEKAKLLS